MESTSQLPIKKGEVIRQDTLFVGTPVHDYNVETGKPNTSTNQDDLREFVFSEKTIRNAFIRKVYSILMVQLAISSGFIAFFTRYQEIGDAIRTSRTGLYVLFGALIVNVILLFSMSCCESARRKAPMNYICLFGFTIVESFILGIISSTYETESVLLAVGLCAVICFALTLYSFQTKYDFTICGSTLYICVWILFILGFTVIFFPENAIIMVYSAAGVVLFSFFLIYDTQKLIGGEHKYAISPEEYVFAALCLYIDIIEIFMLLLRLFGSRR